MLFTALALALLQDSATVQLTLTPKGVSAKLGYYSPQRAEFGADKPAELIRAPQDLKSPSYGVLPIGAGKGTLFVIDEPEGAPARLFVDSNKNGDLSDDKAATWAIDPPVNKDGTPNKTYKGEASVDIGEPGQPVFVNVMMYRFDKDDPKRASMKSMLLYYRDYAYEGEVTLGGKKLHAMLLDESARGDFRGKAPSEEDAKKGMKSGVMLFLDVNGSGKPERRGEMYDVLEPFNIGGTTYELSALTRVGGLLNIVKSAKTV